MKKNEHLRKCACCGDMFKTLITSTRKSCRQKSKCRSLDRVLSGVANKDRSTTYEVYDEESCDCEQYQN